jgi:CRISPR-associated protein Cas1
LWLARGRLSAEDGTLRFVTTGGGDLSPGDYALPFQMLSAVMLGPGTSVTHDALRLLARHGCALVAVGEDGVRFYAGMPFGNDDSALSRRHARAWADARERSRIARRLYALRLGEVLPDADITVLRGIEGARMKETYRLLAHQYGLDWKGRHYDRNAPESADLPNQAINHVVTAVESAAMLAVALTGAIPSLGFIHEDSGNAFTLDVTDLFRDTVTLPTAFAAVRECQQETGRAGMNIERTARRAAGRALREKKIVPTMIDRIKELLHVDDGRGDA